MITKFDKSNLKNIRADISALLSAYAKENGIEIKIGNISFDDGSFTTKMEAKVKGAKTKEDSALEFIMASRGFVKTSKCGKTLVGYNSRSKAYPFIFESAGKKYKCSEQGAVMYFSK